MFIIHSRIVLTRNSVHLWIHRKRNIFFENASLCQKCQNALESGYCVWGCSNRRESCILAELDRLYLKEICHRGNNKVVIYISLYHDKCLLFILELY